jgi:hypothetical protein
LNSIDLNDEDGIREAIEKLEQADDTFIPQLSKDRGGCIMLFAAEHAVLCAMTQLIEKNRKCIFSHDFSTYHPLALSSKREDMSVHEFQKVLALMITSGMEIPGKSVSAPAAPAAATRASIKRTAKNAKGTELSEDIRDIMLQAFNFNEDECLKLITALDKPATAPATALDTPDDGLDNWVTAVKPWFPAHVDVKLLEPIHVISLLCPHTPIWKVYIVLILFRKDAHTGSRVDKLWRKSAMANFV